jgi:hypothetical protein
MTDQDDDVMGVLASAYGVRRDFMAVTAAIMEKLSVCKDLDTWEPVAQIVGILVQDSANLDRIRSGRPIKNMYREAMLTMVSSYSPSVPAEKLIESVIADIRTSLQR